MLLGLHAQPQEYLGWSANAGARLVFLAPEWQAYEPLLATHYVRRTGEAAEGDQFDLFLDSAATAALADLRRALRTRDASGARRALDALIAREPAHRLRAAAERLMDALADLPTPLPAASAGAELRTIEQSLVPAARDVLCPDARDLLAPFWRRLAAALADAPFDAERPRLHASHAYACALDWPRVIAAIEAVPGHAGPVFRRPFLIVSANSFYQSRIGTVIAAVITLNLRLGEAPGNVRLPARSGGLPKVSVVNVSQLVTVDKRLPLAAWASWLLAFWRRSMPG